MQGTRITDKDFFAHDADQLAVMLLGKTLVRNIDGKTSRYIIAETECYMGISDTACHACRGKTTKTSTMWEQGGTLYVHLIYGMHYMMNIIAGEYGNPMGVLIRGVKGIKGPGRVTRQLSIGKDFNRENILTSTRIWIEDNNITPVYNSTPRIGIGYAKVMDRERLWRFEAYDFL